MTRIAIDGKSVPGTFRSFRYRWLYLALDYTHLFIYFIFLEWALWVLLRTRTCGDLSGGFSPYYWGYSGVSTLGQA
jgi:hypothetical protein